MPAKSPAALTRRKQTNARYREKHRAKLRAGHAAWRWQNAERIRDYRLRHFYGMTTEDAQAMLAAQDGLCAVCSTPLEYPSKQAHIDHDHATGKVRGVVCIPCNTGIGHVERPGWLAMALEYLKTTVAK